MISMQNESDLNIAERFSSYNKLIRFFAIMTRFKNFKLNIESCKSNRLTYKEIQKTELKYLKYLQGLMFLPKNYHKLSTVQTFKDNDGLLRLKTKILERKDSYLFLCPIVLDYKHEAITLLIRETHENLCHASV